MDIRLFSPVGRRARPRRKAFFIIRLFRFIFEKTRNARENRRNMEEFRRLGEWALSDLGISRVDFERITSDSRYRDSSLLDRWRS